MAVVTALKKQFNFLLVLIVHIQSYLVLNGASWNIDFILALLTDYALTSTGKSKAAWKHMQPLNHTGAPTDSLRVNGPISNLDYKPKLPPGSQSFSNSWNYFKAQ